MKKSVLLTLCLVIGMSLITSMAFAYTFAYTPGNGIAGTPHDLGSTGIGAAYGDSAEQTGLNRICIFCHAPHNTLSSTQAANAQITYFPLWNLGVTTASYVMYTPGADMPSNTSHMSQAKAFFDASGNTRPGSVSRLCLSCHDGTVSTNSYGFYAASSQQTGADVNVVGTMYEIGGSNDLKNHHPIGFDYDTVQVTDDEIAVKTTVMAPGVRIADLLWAGNMECTTCHDVHNTKNPGAEKFLWKSDAGSEFCMTCHLKKE